MLTRAARGLPRAIPKFTRSLITPAGKAAWQQGRANVAQKTLELQETGMKAFESKFMLAPVQNRSPFQAPTLK